MTVSPAQTFILANVAEISSIAIQIGILGQQRPYGAQLKLVFDPSIVEILEILTGPVLGGSGKANEAGGFFESVAIDNEGGSAEYVVTLLSPAQPPAQGGGLAFVSFKCKASGPTQLSVTELIVADQNGREVAGQAGGAEMTCRD